MVHKHSIDALRAVRRGFLRRRRCAAFIVSPVVAVAAEAAIKSLELHATRDILTDTPHHHGHQATWQARDSVPPRSRIFAMRCHRGADALKHGVGAAAVAAVSSPASRRARKADGREVAWADVCDSDVTVDGTCAVWV